jgi:Asp-tRNA(Asn)/Glu-tRNA(Gln) amidotransferase A subunit family amidase
VVCYHCRATFCARNPDAQQHTNNDAEEILRRVDALLNPVTTQSTFKIANPK